MYIYMSPGTSGSADPLDALSQAQAQALAPAAPALPYEVLDVIASEARSDFQRLCDTVRLTAVHVKTAQHVSCIAFLFSDGTKRTHGGVASGTWREPLCLSPGEFLTRVSGEAGELLTAVRFDTSHGRSVRYSGQGSAGGVPFELQPPSGHEILDVSSRCSSIFRTVGGLQVLTQPVASRPAPWTEASARLLCRHAPHVFGVSPPKTSSASRARSPPPPPPPFSGTG